MNTPLRITLLATLLVPGTAAVSQNAPVAPALVTAPGSSWLERVQDSATQFSFVVEATGPVRVEINPKLFHIQAGVQYSVNSSYFAPMMVQAKQDGQLVLNLNAPRNCTVLIEASKGGNLLPDPSFEYAMDHWNANLDRTLKATLEHGHEGLNENGLPLPADTPVKASAGQFFGMARTGRGSYHISKSTWAGNIEMKLARPVEVHPGQEYLLSGYYHLKNPRFGSAMHFIATLNGAGQKPLYFRDVLLNPLIDTNPGEWRRSFLRFKVPASYTQATVTISVSGRGAPFTAYWDDMELRIAPTPVTQWLRPTTEADRKPERSPEQVREIMKTRAPVRVAVKSDDGSPRLMVNDAPVPLFGHTAGPNLFPNNGAYKDFLQSGVKLHWIPLYTGQTGQHKQYGEPIWLADGKYDFAEVDKRLTHVLGHDPNALVLFYCYVKPYPEFVDQNPDAAWIDYDGNQTVGEKSAWRPAADRKPWEGFNHSYTASEFRRQSGEMLRALGQHLATSDLGKNVVGLHLVCGADGQWLSQHAPDHWDRSPGAQAAFRDWLRVRYNDDAAALQRAWNDPQASFITAALPPEAARAPEKWFLDANNGADRKVIDANRFSADGVAQTINGMARAFKTGLGRPAIVTTYYADILHNHQLNNWSLKTLVEGSDLDGVISVMDYGLWRAAGRTSGFSSLVGSLRLHNKLFIQEMDYRTDYSWLPNDALAFRKDWGVSSSEEEWLNLLRRDLGMSLTQGEGGWIYALGGNGWRNEKYMAGIAEGVRAAQEAAARPIANERGQIAAFCDEQIEDYTSRRNAFGATLAMTGHNAARATLIRSGLSWDAYLLSDVENPARPKAKINLFLSAETLTPAQITWIQQNLQKDGNILVFVSGAGYSLGDGFEKNIRALTGMTVKCDPNQAAVYRYTPVPNGKPDPLAAGLSETLTESLTPLFYVDDPTAISLAQLNDTGKIGAAVKRHPGWTAVYLSLSGGFTPRLLRSLAREAGITPYGPEDDATFAGNGFLVIHALHAGRKTLNWPVKSDVLDLTSNKVIAHGVQSLSVDMKVGESRWFRRLPPDTNR